MEAARRSKERGDEAGNLIESLRGIEREHIRYEDFVRRFAVIEERMFIDIDSFDYAYYTYGLQVYGDVPLIEPLEYKEVHSIREFVIAIDTSGSCDAELVKKFLTKTYDILSEPVFDESELKVYIVQCDAAVQSETVIEDMDGVRDYIENFEVRGGGGTDFRPVFKRVEELRGDGKLARLRGLLYFTDGYGVFPEKPTDYRTAFVFAEVDGQVDVPPWAMKINIEEEGL